MTMAEKIWAIIGCVVLLLAIGWLFATMLSFKKLGKRVKKAYKSLRVPLDRLYTLTDRAVGMFDACGDTSSIMAAKNEALALKPKHAEKRAECDAVLRSRLRKLLNDCGENDEAATLKNEMDAVEAEIFKARKGYNSVVREFNCKRKMFPDKIAGAIFKFKLFEFYTADEAEEI